MKKSEIPKFLKVVDEFTGIKYENLEFATMMFYNSFQDIEYKDLAKAFMDLLNKGTPIFKNTLIGLLKQCVVSSKIDILPDTEVWNIVYKAIGNVSDCYSYEQNDVVFKRLPVLVQRALGDCNTLVRWSRIDISDVETSIKPVFLKQYKQLATYEAERLATGKQTLIDYEKEEIKNLEVGDKRLEELIAKAMTGKLISIGGDK